MKEFYFTFRNPLSRVNHTLADSIPSDTSHDVYPDDHKVANAIADYAGGLNDCAYLINEWTRNRLLKEYGESRYLEKIKIDGNIFFIVTIHFEKLPIQMPDGSKKYRQTWDSPIRQIKELNIPSYIPQK